ncbi:hypothetical protein ACP4OV_022669 [Aristida adscensionis]
MRATTRRGGAGGLPTKKTTAKKKKAAERGFMCGCGGAKSVATVSCAAAVASISAVAPTPAKATAAASTAKAGASATKTAAVPGPASRDAEEGAPSVDALLWQLRELERGVRALGVRDDAAAGAGAHGGRPRHRRAASGGGGRLEAESVAVVTESADPLGDFRRSMAQMIVENGITGGAELRELLQRFLSLNSARHHHLILRAFADVWEELFAAGHQPPPPAAETTTPYSGRGSKRPRARAADTLTTVAA